ncbi:MAG: VCBS repeat-containing protein, partial [Planctomyces sp.]
MCQSPSARLIVLRLLLLVAGFSFVDRMAMAQQFQLRTFQRKQLTDVYYSEGISAGDLNNDGVSDVIYGPHWYAGPDYSQRQ